MAYLTREEAVEKIYAVINSGIIKDELEEDLANIANSIENEEKGLFTWGAEDEVVDLFIAKRSDLITPEWEKHCADLYEKYRIKEPEAYKSDSDRYSEYYGDNIDED